MIRALLSCTSSSPQAERNSGEVVLVKTVNHFNKQRKPISHIKLTLTTSCSSACSYCFVRKTGERMTLAVAKRSVDLLFNAPGKQKFIEMFGGEPFLAFPTIEGITSYAKKRARAKRKDLTLSVCTNLTVLSSRQMDFIKKRGLKITVSLVGEKEYHDRFRFFADGRGTYGHVVRNLKRLSVQIPPANLGISFVVPPALSHRIFENFMHILDLGFSRNINLEIVENFGKWGRVEQWNFINHFQKIITELHDQLNKEPPFFLNPLSWELAQNKISIRQGTHCPFHEPLEIYPNGDMAFSPFVLNREDKEKYIIGNILTGFKDPYGYCFFDPKDKRCVHCLENYFGSPVGQVDNAGLVREFYGLTCLKAAQGIKKSHPQYVDYCRQHLCF